MLENAISFFIYPIKWKQKYHKILLKEGAEYGNDA